MNLKEMSDLMWDKAAAAKSYKLEPSDIAAWQTAKDVGWLDMPKSGSVYYQGISVPNDLTDAQIYGTPAIGRAIPVAEALNAEISKKSTLLSMFPSEAKETNVIGGDTCHLCGESKTKRVQTTEDCQCGCDGEFSSVETTYACDTVVTRVSADEMEKDRVDVVLGLECIDISNAVAR